MDRFDLTKNYTEQTANKSTIRGYESSLENQYNPEILKKLLQFYRLAGDWNSIKKVVNNNLSFINENDKFMRNYVLNESEIAQEKTKLTTRPRFLSVTLTSRCNLNCIMCTAKENIWEIPKESMNEIKALFPYLEFIMWRGGEVFLLEYFEELLEEAGCHPQLKQLIITNGLLLTPQLISRLLLIPKLVLVFSIDSIHKKVYESIRKGAEFDKLIKNLELINEKRKEYNSKIALNLNVVVMKSNHAEITQFIDFAKQYGFGTVLFAPPSGKNCDPINIFNNNNEEILAEIQEKMDYIQAKANEYKIIIDNRLPRYPLKDNRDVSLKNNFFGYFCYAPWQRLTINWNGNVYPDCMCVNPEKGGIGNIKDISLREIWNGKGMQIYRERIINGNFQELCNPACLSGQIPERYLKLNN